MVKGGLLFCLSSLKPEYFGLQLHERVRPTCEIQQHRPQLQGASTQHPVKVKQPLTFPLDLAPLGISAQTVAQLCRDPRWGSAQVKNDMGGGTGTTNELAQRLE